MVAASTATDDETPSGVDGSVRGHSDGAGGTVTAAAHVRRLLAVVSNSTGKDSGITAELAIEEHGRENVRIAFADTGNEHQLVYDHLEYQRERYGEVVTLRADFSRQIARKRIYVQSVWPTKGVPETIVQRTLGVLQPTGVPFLDLCLWKGRFPSRKAQFCTQELKRRPLDAFMLELLSTGVDLESWRGLRRDESTNRKDTLDRELAAEGWWIRCPIAGWTAEQIIAEHARRGLKLNPLYTMGFSRVGCMPCINENKDGLLAISQRFPQHIDKIREWESLVSLASRRGWTTFFCGSAEADEADEAIYNRYRIDSRIEWANTSHGGRQFDFIRQEPPAQCSSVYGLCE